MGAQVRVKDIDKKWAKVYLYEDNVKYAYVPSNHLIKIGRRIKDWVSIAEN